MRISGHKVAQVIEKLGHHNTLVIVDESTGNEVELTPSELYHIVQFAEYSNFIARTDGPPV